MPQVDFQATGGDGQNRGYVYDSDSNTLYVITDASGNLRPTTFAQEGGQVQQAAQQAAGGGGTPAASSGDGAGAAPAAATVAEDPNSYQAAINFGETNVQSLQQQHDALVGKINAIPAAQQNSYSGSGFDLLSQQLQDLDKQLGAAQNSLAVTYRAQAAAASKKVTTDPAHAALYQAQAKAATDKAQTYGAQSQMYSSHSALYDAQAAKAQADAELSKATTPDAIREAKAKADAAQVALATAQTTAKYADQNAAAGVSSAQSAAATAAAQAAVAGDLAKSQASTAGSQATVAAAQATQAPAQAQAATQTAQAGASTAGSQATVAAAQAALAPQAAQAAVDNARAVADKAQQDYQTAKRAYDNTTDAQVKAGIQADLDAKQVAVQQAQQQLDLATKNQQNVINQSAANVQATEANTATQLQGRLAGLQARKAQLEQLVRQGVISGDDATRMIAQDAATAAAGTDVNTAMNEQNQQDTSRLGTAVSQRGQDASLAAQKASTFGSVLSNAASTFSKLNDTTAPGSDAQGQAFLATLKLARNYLDTYQAPAAIDIPRAPSVLQGVGLTGQGAGVSGMNGGTGNGTAATAAPSAPTTFAPGGAPPAPPSAPMLQGAGIAQGMPTDPQFAALLAQRQAQAAPAMQPIPNATGAPPMQSMPNAPAPTTMTPMANPTNGTAGHTITINIGGSGSGDQAPSPTTFNPQAPQSSQMLDPNAPGLPSDPAARAQMPDMLKAITPATPQDIAYAFNPNKQAQGAGQTFYPQPVAA